MFVKSLKSRVIRRESFIMLFYQRNYPSLFKILYLLSYVPKTGIRTVSVSKIASYIASAGLGSAEIEFAVFGHV